MIEKLRELEKAATPGPWQTRFLHRAYAAGRDLPDLEYGTKPEQDWADCELMAEMRNSISRLLDVAEAAGEIAYCHHPIYKGVDTPVDCGSCSGCKIRKTLDALEETK